MRLIGGRFYGFRVAEPHHDGTPHWRTSLALTVFVEPEYKQAMLDVFQHYCFEEDGTEKGADKHRLKVVEIDPNRGGATSYIAKYVSKNIDGKGLDKGVYGEDPIIAAERIEAWASCFGIRQFQQIGGASVTVWRELRRLKALCTETFESLEAIRQSADESDWQSYTKLVGGVFAKRKEQPIRPRSW
ncbi:replication endonuclease [Catenovulum sp. SM1970]|uniref:replication endonuclease n=1 Tax=Marinifaba aquimaris TaxID=2741323 RepID=UPI0015729D52|nr:replication endonuclease [Marinifaba aquimaris]NTS78142.1 replication endonuclease [Marinifaba aquimaris]